MDGLTRAIGSLQQHFRFAALIISLTIVGSLLFLWGQLAGLALLPLIGLLLLAVDRRDRRARDLAARIADDRQIDKVEVPHGAWGDLARAVNGLLQERRVEQRLRAARNALHDVFGQRQEPLLDGVQVRIGQAFLLCEAFERGAK